MDSTIMNATTLGATAKEDEKALCENVYQNISVLTIFYEPSSDLVDVLKPDMFLKPNSRAFLHVFYYLFKILDEAEVKKRFYWPTVNKKMENQFRTDTIIYLNHLNTKHKLGMETIQTRIGVIPGGYKFLKVLNVITMLVMQEDLQQFGSLPQDLRRKSPDEMRAEIKESKVCLIETRETIRKIDENTAKVSKDNKEIRATMNGIANSMSDGSLDVFTFIDVWKAEVDAKFNKINPYLQELETVNAMLERLCLMLEQKDKNKQEHLVKFNKTEVEKCHEKLLRLIEDKLVDISIAPIVVNSEINFENLLKTFNFLLPGMLDRIRSFEFRSISTLDSEIAGIETLLNQSRMVSNRILAVEKLTNVSAENQHNATLLMEPCKDYTSSMINTPTISNKLLHNKPIAPIRISLREEKVPPATPIRGPLKTLPQLTQSTGISSTSRRNDNSVGLALLKSLKKKKREPNDQNRSSSFRSSLFGMSQPPAMSSTMISINDSAEASFSDQKKLCSLSESINSEIPEEIIDKVINVVKKPENDNKEQKPEANAQLTFKDLNTESFDQTSIFDTSDNVLEDIL